MVLPTHLDAVAQSLAACAERGQWQQCVPMAACFVAGHGAATSRFPETIGRMSARDRLVYALDVERYEALVLGEGDGCGGCAAGAALADLTALTQNPLALNIARQEERGASDGTTLNGRWRLQREKKQRRWQCPSKQP